MDKDQSQAKTTHAKPAKLNQRALLRGLNKIISSGISFYASGGLTTAERKALQELRDLTGTAVSKKTNSGEDDEG